MALSFRSSFATTPPAGSLCLASTCALRVPPPLGVPQPFSSVVRAHCASAPVLPSPMELALQLGQSKKTIARTSMDSRGGASGGVIGSSNAV